MNLSTYFSHIHLQHETNKPTLSLLRAIHRQHLLHIPFENLDIHLGKKLSMDPVVVFKKITEHNRGGLCFEVNSLLYSILTLLDYKVSYISASFWNTDKQSWNPDFSHLALLVHLNGAKYLFDVGVGGGFTEPLHILDRYQHHDQNGHYLVEATDDSNIFIIKKNSHDHWNPLFKIDTNPRVLQDFEEMCSFTQIDSDSLFTQKKLCSIITETGRISLTDEYIKVTNGDDITITPVTSRNEWTTALWEYFHIEL